MQCASLFEIKDIILLGHRIVNYSEFIFFISHKKKLFIHEEINLVTLLNLYEHARLNLAIATKNVKVVTEGSSRLG